MFHILGWLPTQCIAKDDSECVWSFCSHAQALGSQVWNIRPPLCSAGDGTQSFGLARQVLCQLSSTPRPVLRFLRANRYVRW